MANIYKSNYTGEQIDNSVGLTQENTATQGQVLTANGTGGAVWQDAKGTEVVANPVLAGTEGDLTGLEVAGTKYKVSTGGSGGGTQLYAHHIIIFNGGFDVEFTMYSTVSNAFTIDSLVQYLEPFGSLNVSGVFTDSGQNKSYPLVSIDAHSRVSYILNDEEVSEIIDATKFDDTLTPL